MPRGLRAVLAALCAAAGIVAIGLVQATAAKPKDPKVSISGRAYAFNHMDTFLAGATIRVREVPTASATTDAHGDYTLEVPDETNVTPYIEPPPGYNQIDLQTFHTRGKAIVNANFQVPGDLEYNALAALLSVPFGPDGRPEQCVIVTTASARDVRGVDYETFHARTPHGVAGATAKAKPALPSPVYFNENVIPDRNQPSTSGDGGIIWTAVPAGSYRVITKSPTTQFASFLATCEAGRVVNANPPWGAYELSPGEKPLGAGVVAASMTRAKAKTSGGKRLISVRVRSAASVRANLALSRGGDRLARTSGLRVQRGKDTVKLVVGRTVDPGQAKLQLTLEDAAGDRVKERTEVRLPRAPGA